jgi:hypothetical protein
MQNLCGRLMLFAGNKKNTSNLGFYSKFRLLFLFDSGLSGITYKEQRARPK